MSILIRGIKMPKKNKCLTITIFPDGVIVPAEGSEIIGHAVPVPSHGDLIDRDVLPVSSMKNCFNGKWVDFVHVDDIENAPIIIEAEVEI